MAILAFSVEHIAFSKFYYALPAIRYPLVMPHDSLYAIR